jgi:4'-phosphopantetheinyl transferase
MVRRVDLARDDDLRSAAAALLSPAELARVETCTPAVGRRRILVRAALRELLASELGVAPIDVPLVDRPGRPALHPSAAVPGLDFNTSASGEVGLVALVRGGRIGVDVERLGDEDPAVAVAEGWLAAAERAAIEALAGRDRPTALTRAWVQKEAVLKGQGVGLWSDLSRTVTPVAARGRVTGWQLVPVEVPTGYLASLALRADSWALRLAARRIPSLRPDLALRRLL